MPTTKQGLRKDVLKVDRVYFSPDGPIPISKTRAKRWIRNFNRMSRAGLVVPMPIEHQDAAKPVLKSHPFLKSKKNFGHLSKLGLDDEGNLFFECELNSNPEAIREGRRKPFVSPEIVPGFRDERCGDVRDCITHMALTDSPVNGEQSGNWYVEKLDDGRMRMSCKGSMRMADDDDDDDDLDVDDEAIRVDDTVGDETEDYSEDIEMEYPMDDGMEEMVDPRVAKAVDDMAAFGVVLPDDTTTVDQFIDRICVAVKALAAAGITTNSAAMDNGEDEDEFADDEEDDFYGGQGRNNAVQEEQGAVLMSQSLETRLQRLENENARLRRQQDLHEKEQRMSRRREAEQSKDLIQDRIYRCRELGKIPKEAARELVDQLETVQMSFGPSGRQSTTIEERLAVYEQVPTGTFSPVTREGHRMSASGNISEHSSPTGLYAGRHNRSSSFFDDDDEGTKKSNGKSVTEEMAKMANIDLKQ